MGNKSVGELKALAQKYSLQGKRALAAETYQLLFKEEPSNPRWPQKAGEEYRTIGQKDKAIATFQAAAKLYAHQGFTLKAMTLCKLVLDLDKNNQAAQQMLAGFSAVTASAPPPPAPPPQPAPPPGPPELFEPPELIELPEVSEPQRPFQPEPSPREPEPSGTPGFPEPPELIEIPEPPEPLLTLQPEALLAPESTPAPGLAEFPEMMELPQTPETTGTPLPPEEPELVELTDFPQPEPRPQLQPVESPRQLQTSAEPAPAEVPAPAEIPAPAAEPASVQQPGPTEQLGIAELTEMLNLEKLPDRKRDPATFSISIPPGEALGTIDLGRAMSPAGSQSLDLEAIEIIIDDLETVESAPPSAQAAPPAVSPKDEILMRMPPVPIFSFLGTSALRALVEKVEVRTFPPGARLITQGETGHSLFVLVDGEVAVLREGPPRVEITRLKEGAFFGEIALVTKAPRTATVEAVRECQVLEISREVFNELIQTYPDMIKVVLRHLRERLVDALVDTHPLFTPFAGPERVQLVRRFSLLEAARDCVLAQEGMHANGMYIVLCGEAESSRGGAVQARLASGDIFGVESLLTGQPSQVSVKTLTKCWILKMREDTFREVILTYSPILATLSDMIAGQSRKSDAAAAGGAFEQLGIPIF